MPIKSFKGLLLDTEQERINIQTNTGLTGFRIVKFQIMPNDPFGADYESVVTVFKEQQTVAPGTVDFSENRLLAAAIWSSRGSAESYPEDTSIIFDNEIFNQDIFVMNQDTKGNTGMNYYIELEQIKLSSDEATAATLKDIRNIR